MLVLGKVLQALKQMSRFFATQDRMVTADDYTIMSTASEKNIRKIKSVNRVHSGHSRFRDIYDPNRNIQ